MHLDLDIESVGFVMNFKLFILIESDPSEARIAITIDDPESPEVKIQDTAS